MTLTLSKWAELLLNKTLNYIYHHTKYEPNLSNGLENISF